MCNFIGKKSISSSNFHCNTFHLITNANFMTSFTVWIFLNMNSIFLLLSINSFFPGLHYRTGHHMTTSDRKFGVWWGQVLAKTRNVPTCPEMVLCLANFTFHERLVLPISHFLLYDSSQPLVIVGHWKQIEIIIDQIVVNWKDMWIMIIFMTWLIVKITQKRGVHGLHTTWTSKWPHQPVVNTLWDQNHAWCTRVTSQFSNGY